MVISSRKDASEPPLHSCSSSSQRPWHLLRKHVKITHYLVAALYKIQSDFFSHWSRRNTKWAERFGNGEVCLSPIASTNFWALCFTSLGFWAKFYNQRRRQCLLLTWDDQSIKIWETNSVHLRTLCAKTNKRSGLYPLEVPQKDFLSLGQSCNSAFLCFYSFNGVIAKGFPKTSTVESDFSVRAERSWQVNHRFFAWRNSPVQAVLKLTIIT
jgi:hypothetical protein